MQNACVRKIWGSKWRVFALVVVTGAFIFVGSSITIGVKYDLSPVHAARLLFRNAVLSATCVFTMVYDPTTIIDASLGLDAAESPFDYKDYCRIETLFSSAMPGESYQITRIDNHKIKPIRFHFSYQTYDEPRLAILRDEFKLQDVVAAAKDEFEAMVLLRNWTRGRFRRNDFQPRMENFDALQVLKRNLRNNDGEPYKPSQYRPCHFSPLLYSQILLSMGYQPRLVRISGLASRGYDGHGMTEVWSNQFGKWITMDVDLNLHYEMDGIPLNMLEVHNERYEKGASRVRIVRGLLPSEDDDERQVDVEGMIRYHTYIQIVDMRNDWMTNHYFKGHPKRSDKASLFWVDKNLPHVFNLAIKTDRVDDFYWTLNQTEIFSKGGVRSGGVLKLAFKTFTPGFKQFQIVVDEAKEVLSPLPQYNWQLHPGRNSLLVRSINKYDVRGIPSSVEIVVY